MISALQAAFFSSTGKLKWMRFNLCSKLRAGLQRICWLYLISGLTPPTSKNYRPLGGPKKGGLAAKKMVNWLLLVKAVVLVSLPSLLLLYAVSITTQQSGQGGSCSPICREHVHGLEPEVRAPYACTT